MYLFIRSSTNPGPRVNRIINYFKSPKREIVYLSPYRKGDNVDKKYRGMGSLGEYDYFDGSGFRRYLSFILSVNWAISKKIIRYRKDIKFIHFSDLEIVLLGSIICKLFGIKFVYNIHDNYFQRYNFSRLINTFLKYIESFYILISDKTLVPELFRKSCYPKLVHSKIFILRNYPDFDVSANHLFFPDKKISMFYGGWISTNRSIEHYFDLANSLISRGYKVEFSICGWGDSNYIESLSKKSESIGMTFSYLGQLSQKEAVEYLKKSDISIAYYNPEKIINIFAASNKIPEIIGSSTVLITNEHTEIAKKIKPLKVSLQFNESIDEVIDDLILLIEDDQLMSDFNKRANNFYRSEYDSLKLISKLEEIFCEFI